MASKYWVKLYLEIIDDYKMGKLTRTLRYRVIEMFCLAGEVNELGYLPPTEQIAWRLRENIEQLESDLIELAKVGILDQRNGRWFVVNFAKRQAPSPATERVQEFRKRQRNADETKSFSGNAPDTDTEKKEEELTPPPSTFISYPQSPLEAINHPDIKIFHEVSAITPGKNDYKSVIDAIRLLRKAHPDDEDLRSYLLPFWLDWTGRKTKDGKAFNPLNIAWLTEWALNNQRPDPRENGHAKANLLQGMTPA